MKNKNKKVEIHVFLSKPKENNINLGDEVLDAKWFNPKEINKLKIVKEVREIIEEITKKDS